MSASPLRSRAAAARCAPWLAAVLVAPACLPRPASARPRHVAGVTVQAMVVGRGGAVLARARRVIAGGAHLSLAGRSCAVAPATPLAALIAVRHSGGPAFTLRDYGRCDSSPADSSQLFVTSVGGQHNAGQDGWVYKAEGIAGSTGAADPSGALGNGRRLRVGAKVLWFYCHMGLAGGCQRTLEVLPQSGTVAAGAPLQVSVTGEDDEGAAALVAGATVTLGTSTATSLAPGGVATVIAPTVPGRYQLSASGPGLVPSFPVAVQVR